MKPVCYGQNHLIFEKEGAVIELDRDPDMMPRFGNLKRQAPGVWHFRGRDIDSALVISGKRTDESQK